jgi:peptidoglycan/LPS O-acetylase OafA/YrhL
VIPPEPLPSTRGVHRIEQLDSLRGMAALIVFFAHCSFLYPGVTAASAASIKSPLRFLFDGHPAVLFFFLLSGYVLYLPYNRRNVHPRYLPYVVRRICRIYLPYLAGIAFAAIASFLAYRPVPNVGDLFAWHPVSHAALVRNAVLFASFILPFDRNIWNGSTWSLAEEMRVSLFFPFLALAVRFSRGVPSWHRSLSCRCYALLPSV